MMLFDVFYRATQWLYRKITGNQEIAKTGLTHISLCCFAEQSQKHLPAITEMNFKYSYAWGAFSSHQKFSDKSPIKNLQVILHSCPTQWARSGFHLLFQGLQALSYRTYSQCHLISISDVLSCYTSAEAVGSAKSWERFFLFFFLSPFFFRLFKDLELSTSQIISWSVQWGTEKMEQMQLRANQCKWSRAQPRKPSAVPRVGFGMP